MENSSKPPRRIRYKGTHPKSFKEKYKEHQPEKYSADIEKIIAEKSVLDNYKLPALKSGQKKSF